MLGLLITTAASWSVRRDSARRAMVEEELRRAAEQLMAVLENIGDGVVVAYADGRFAHYNPAAQRMLGRGPTEASPAQWAREFNVFRVDAVTPFPADELPLDLAIRGVATDQVDMLIKRASGEPGVFLTVTGRPINDSNGLVVGGVVILHDITERKRAEEKLTRSAEELRGSNQELERFAFVASHDLQAPLRMVVSYVELIERRYADKLDSSAREFIAYALGGARRMQTLTADLLALSRVGTRPHRPKPVDSSETLDQVLLTLQSSIEEAGAAIHRGQLPRVMTDVVQLGQVFQNLIVNALKFHGKDPPHIEISARCEGGVCEFLVADNGPGIAPEHRENIFVMFERVPGTQKHAGTGIGLATCKKIVERHGGRIWAEPGAATGAVFHFTLPAASAARPISAGEQTAA
jgi:signal transduction histidine kinase